MASVRLKSVSKRFGTTVVVDDVTLDIADREFLVLVGPSGCGKSTTLRMIAGLEEASGGDIFIGDRRVNDLGPKDRDIAMVFQNYALYPHMNVYDNMAFGLKMRSMPRAEIDQRVNEAAEILGLGPLLKRKPKEMSGGQRQRAALGRAIVRHPAVFLMDEPLSNLDAKLRVQTRTEIVKLHERVATTMIYVTHDQIEAMTMGHRIVVMKDGVVQQVASPQEVYDHPANQFVAGFIGSPTMSFLPCRLEAEDGALFARGASFSVRLPDDKRAKLTASHAAAVTLGVRPEDIALHANEAGSIPAVVDAVESLGSEQVLYFRCDGAQVTARASAQAAVATGDTIALGIDPRRMHLFDAASGGAYF
ncbi:glycerol-3-phosphate ABC transporter ATP-binding protein [Vulcanimicrobium alpinum]|uniref:Glycerol-3-phosphate ABC transporter ATP-binding protein n=1 Tax=Vulcanimicrobium alpinum TaxID=3016050 RepID=A0AAN2CAX1_UNVUL|nr:sn-glycerol-3-phosphate ABC transporter ATP-binding protein UgpC [Vulcanimicrobium alpinum]BDE07571.1 glycerol-3-phosphate ABC transporter ATP-binding protein [Vulcanimicrobium alpinum]